MLYSSAMKNYIPGQPIAVLRPTFLCAAPSVILWMLLAVVGICVAFHSGNAPVPMTLAIIFTLACLIRVTIVSIRAGLAQACNRYTITTEVIHARTGFFSTRSAQVRLADIRGISVTRTLMGRLLGYASAEIGSAATAGSEVKIENVRNLDRVLARLNI